MIKSRIARAKENPDSLLRSGAIWFFASNLLTPLVAVALGPFILRKVGLEEYAVLSLVAYFLSFVAGYSDFASYTHLLIAFSNKAPTRFADLGNTFVLKTGILIFFFVVLIVYSRLYPRNDDLYSLLAIFMAGVPIALVNVEWYFVSRKRYRQFFLSRLAAAGLQISLTLAWFLSDRNNAFFLPCITFISVLTGSSYLVWNLGRQGVLKDGLATLRRSSSAGVRALIHRLFPMAATLLITPYFLAYALPWYSLVNPDRRMVGSFSIAYRLIIGISTLVGPLLIYLIPRRSTLDAPVRFQKTLGLSILAGIAFWILGIPTLWAYFHFSKSDPELLSHSVRSFSVLMLGIFFLCIRTPYVGKCLVWGRYREFFGVHLICCLPILIISWVGGKRIPSEWVAWLACLPDFLTTAVFVGLYRFGRKGPVQGGENA